MPATSRGVTLLGPDKLEIREYPIPDIPSDGGLVKVELGGVCGSDVKYLHPCIFTRRDRKVHPRRRRRDPRALSGESADQTVAQACDLLIVEIWELNSTVQRILV
jgi:hypothetical protein